MTFFLLMACATTELQFAVTGGEDFTLESASARVRRYQLVDCDDEPRKEWVGRRIDLFDPLPDIIRDRAWCEVAIEFPQGGLYTPLRLEGVTDGGAPFSMEMRPETITLRAPFGGEREELVLLLDPDALFSGRALDDELAALQAEAAQEGGASVDSLDFSATSAWSEAASARLGDALSVVTLSAASARADWLLGEALEGRAERPVEQGCRAQDDTSAGWEDTAAASDTAAAAASGGGGGCGDDDDEPAGDDTDEDSGEDEGDDGGGGCGDDDDSGAGALPARGGLAAALLLAWGLRRRA